MVRLAARPHDEVGDAEPRGHLRARGPRLGNLQQAPRRSATRRRSGSSPRACRAMSCFLPNAVRRGRPSARSARAGRRRAARSGPPWVGRHLHIEIKASKGGDVDPARDRRLRDRGGDRAVRRPRASRRGRRTGRARWACGRETLDRAGSVAPRWGASRKGRAGHGRRGRDRPRDRAGARRRGRGRRRGRPRRGGGARRRGGHGRPRVRLRRRRPRGGPRDGRVRRRGRAAGSTSSTSTRASRPAAASATTSTSPATGARWARTSTGSCSASTPPCPCCGTAARSWPPRRSRA